MKLRHEIEEQPLVAGDEFKQIGSTLKMRAFLRGHHKRYIRAVAYFGGLSNKVEAGLFNELPAPAYVVGFLRSYGRCVGLP